MLHFCYFSNESDAQIRERSKILSGIFTGNLSKGGFVVADYNDRSRQPERMSDRRNISSRDDRNRRSRESMRSDRNRRSGRRRQQRRRKQRRRILISAIVEVLILVLLAGVFCWDRGLGAKVTDVFGVFSGPPPKCGGASGSVHQAYHGSTAMMGVPTCPSIS